MSETFLIAERAIASGSDELWSAAVEHLARRFDAIRPLPRAEVADRAAALPALEAWAGEAIANWRVELARFYGDHTRVHLRRDPGVSAILTALRTRGDKLVGIGAGPREGSEAVFSFLGLTRRLDRIAFEGAAEPAGRAIATRRELEALVS